MKIIKIVIMILLLLLLLLLITIIILIIILIRIVDSSRVSSRLRTSGRKASAWNSVG